MKTGWTFSQRNGGILLTVTPWTSEDLIVSNPPYIPTKSEAAGKLSPHSGGPGGFSSGNVAGWGIHELNVGFIARTI